METFKPGTAPPDTYSVIGYDTGVRQGAEVRAGTGARSLQQGRSLLTPSQERSDRSDVSTNFNAAVLHLVALGRGASGIRSETTERQILDFRTFASTISPASRASRFRGSEGRVDRRRRVFVDGCVPRRPSA